MHKIDLLTHCANCAGAIAMGALGLECEQLVGKKSNVPACGVPTLFNGTLPDNFTDSDVEDVKPHFVGGRWIPAVKVITVTPQTVEQVTESDNTAAAPVVENIGVNQ